MPAETRLRVLDFGSVAPLRSQTLWHAVAMGVSDGLAPPTLSFARPDGPYVSIGYHRNLSEVDTAACAAKSLPVYRRMVGGGPVYLDSNQLFFQITLPAVAVPPLRSRALRKLLAPAVQGFRAAGIDAELDAETEIVVGDRKVCGHGAGQIEQAVTVVGNCIESFDHAEAVSTLRLPDDRMHSDVLELMRRYVGAADGASPIDAGAFVEGAVRSYEADLGLAASPGQLTEGELAHLERLDRMFSDPRWVATGDADCCGGPLDADPPRSGQSDAAGSGSSEQRLSLGLGCRQVKIRAGVYAFRAATAAAVVNGTVVRGAIHGAHLRLRNPGAAADAAAERGSGEVLEVLEVLEAKLEGLGLQQAVEALRSLDVASPAPEAPALFADALNLVDRTGMEAGR